MSRATWTLATTLTLALVGCTTNGNERSTEPDAVLPDAGRYYGTMEDGRLHGKGRITWPDGSRYEGQFVDGVIEGKGRYEFADDSSYEGQFSNGLFHGQGKMTEAGGGVYAGRFEDDAIVSGEYRDGHGNRYEGEFENWQFHGEGEYVTASGDIYRGTFRRGRLQGEGVHEAPSGLVYEGEFRNWRYHGQGTLTQADGDRHVGAFRNGLRHGEGRFGNADGSEVRQGIWAWGEYQGADGKADERRAAAVERAIYQQPQLLDDALNAVAPGEPGRIELYFVGVAPHGGQDVFRKEIDFISRQFEQHYDAAQRSVVLGNHPDTLATRPMATRTSLERTLTHVSRKMNTDEDILFLYITSHGSDDHELAVEQPGFDLPDISSEELASMVNGLPAKWKVVTLSACYSGGYLPALADEHTLVMTAARHDRASFGCSSQSEMTYFGKAYFREALPEADSFDAAFERAQALVRQWEREDGIDRHSLPQIALGDALERHLDAWRNSRGDAPP